jgi:hypothetical protein
MKYAQKLAPRYSEEVSLTFRVLARKVAEGSVSTFRKPRSYKVNTWDNVFLPWLEQYAERYGQKMPNKEGVIDLCVIMCW